MMEFLATGHRCDTALIYAKVLETPENISVNSIEKLRSTYKAVANVLLPEPLLTN